MIYNAFVSICIALISLLPAYPVFAEQAELKGSAYYLQPVSLPENARFEAYLEDVSLADAPAKVLGYKVLQAAGQLPIQFTISYDTDELIKNHRYQLRARILVDKQLWFVTDTAYPVLTENGQDRVNIKLIMLRGKEEPVQSQQGQQHSSTVFTDFPRHFLGLLPCADCASVQYQLDLFSNHAFFIRMQYQKELAAVFYDLGQWAYDAHTQQLTLQGGREAPLFFKRLDNNVLEKLDMHGKPIKSALNYQLLASNTAQPVQPEHLFMQGMYQYMADAAVFRECSTGFKWPVLFEADHLALESAYLAAGLAPGAALKVHIEGGIVLRQSVDNGTDRPHILVQRFIKTLPDEQCAEKQTAQQ